MTFSRPGAFDLSALTSTPQPNPTPGSTAGGSYVVDVTEQNFQTVVLEASQRHVVVLSLWTPRAPQAEVFNDMLASVANSFGGQLLLAQVNIDANPGIAQALGAQSVPIAFGLVKGQPVPLFQGAVDAQEAQRYFDELLKVAVQNGVTGRAEPVGAAPDSGEDAEDQDDPRFAVADEAFAAGDFDTAVAEYEKLRAQHPADAEIGERLAGVRLMARTRDADLGAARQAAADAPDDLAAQMLVADLDVSGGHVQDAFDRLIELVRRTAGDERELVRERLIELFTVVGVADPRVATARRALASALY